MPDDDTEAVPPPPDPEETDDFAEVTPPTIWSDDFIELFSEGRHEDCGLRIGAPTFDIKPPELGDIDGLAEAEAKVRAVEGLVGDVVNIMRSDLPGLVNDLLDPVFGPYSPPPKPPFSTVAPLPFPIPFPPGFSPDVQMRVMLRIFEVMYGVALIPSKFSTSAPTIPDQQFASKESSISIEADEDMRATIRVYSRMESTYSFGRGKGTSFGGQDPGIDPPILLGFDNPWFGKAQIPLAQLHDEKSHPHRMARAQRYAAAQLGVSGASTSVHGGSVDLKTISHGLRMKVHFNGNYGRIRVIAIPPKPCMIAFRDCVVLGPYEEDLRELEATRRNAVEARLAAMLKTLGGLQNTLGLLGSAAGGVPVLGAAVDTGLARASMLIGEKMDELEQGVASANHAQERINIAMAESYPENRPTGGDEDDGKAP